MAGHGAPRRPSKGGQQRANQTRMHVIEETMRCVVAEGFGAANAKHIAERAGVTWGVIQYHFGSRDGLLTAVVETAVEQLVESLDDLPQRLAALDVDVNEKVERAISAVWREFSSPASLAMLEILIATRPLRDAVSTQFMADLGATFDQLGKRIGEGLDSAHGATIGNFIRATLRGVAAAQLVAPIPFDTTAERASLAEIIAAYINHHDDGGGRT